MPLNLGSPMTLLGLPFYEIGEDKLRALVQCAVVERTGLWLNLVTQDQLQNITTDLELHHALIEADFLLPESWLLVSACSQLFHLSLPLYSSESLLIGILAAMPQAPTTMLIPQDSSPEQLINWWHQRFPARPSPHVLCMPTDIWIGNQCSQFLEAVVSTRPGLLCTCLPTPLQEKWIGGYRRYLPGTVIVGLGLSPEIIPVAVTPGRTQERLRHSKSQLLRRISDQTRSLAVQPRAQPRVAMPPMHSHLNSRWAEVRAESRFDATQVETIGKTLVAVLNSGSSLLLDLSCVQFIDSSALGLLITLLKTSEQNDRQFVLIRPTKVVTDALSLVQLDQLFEVAADPDSARIKGDLMARNGHIRFERGQEPNTARIFWRGRVHSLNWEKFWKDTLQVIADVQKLSCAPRDMRFELDLGQVTFIDSLGVGLLLRLVKWSREQFVMISIINPSKPVQQVVSLAQLQGPLLQNPYAVKPSLRLK